MDPKLPWFDRRFGFDYPAEVYPGVLERLRGTPARVEERVGQAPSEGLTRRQDDRWSIQENVGHLLDLEPLWSGRLDDVLEGAETLRPADLTNRRTHDANHNAADVKALCASFRRQRLQWVDRLEELDPSTFARAALHPRLKQPMRLVDLCTFVAEHDDAHLARITELIRSIRSIRGTRDDR